MTLLSGQLQKTLLLAATIGFATSLPSWVCTAYSADLSQLSPVRARKHVQPGKQLADMTLENFVGSSQCLFRLSNLTDN